MVGEDLLLYPGSGNRLSLRGVSAVASVLAEVEVNREGLRSYEVRAVEHGVRGVVSSVVDRYGAFRGDDEFVPSRDRNFVVPFPDLIRGVKGYLERVPASGKIRGVVGNKLEGLVGSVEVPSKVELKLVA